MSQDGFSQISPTEVHDLVKQAPPYQAAAVARSLVGTPVRWTLRFDSMTPLPFPFGTLVGFLDNDPIYSRQVLGRVYAFRYPFLRGAKKGEPFVVTGIIKEVSGSISLRGVQIQAISSFTASKELETSSVLMQMGEYHGGPSTKPEPYQESKQITSPRHRRISNEHLGGGVFLILLFELLLGVIGHWDSVEVKSLLGVIILLCSWWMYEELRYWGWARAKAWTASIALALVAYICAALAYHLADKTPQQIARILPLVPPAPASIDETFRKTQELVKRIADMDKPTPKPTPLPSSLVYSHVTPKEIQLQVEGATPFQRQQVAQGIVGTPVEWKVKLTSISTRIPTWSVGFEFAGTDRPPFIYVDIDAKDGGFLKASKEGDIFTVKGTIKKADLGSIELTPGAIIIP